jgi:hypothetical protein
MFFIWLDLERHFNTYWFFLSFRPAAPMSWGGWGLGLGVPVSLAYALSNVSQEYRPWLKFDFLKELAASLNPYLKPLAKIVFALGIFIGIYTGVLLSVLVARPLWNTRPAYPLSRRSGLGGIIIPIATEAPQLFFTRLTSAHDGHGSHGFDFLGHLLRGFHRNLSAVFTYQPILCIRRGFRPHSFAVSSGLVSMLLCVKEK